MGEGRYSNEQVEVGGVVLRLISKSGERESGYQVLLQGREMHLGRRRWREKR